MKNAQAAATYRLAQFESAPPVKIVQMLYSGAIRFLRLAKEMDPSAQEYRDNIRRAEDIICELRASLNHEPNADLTANLERLYLFMQEQLGHAVLERDPQVIDATIEILTTLLDGWKEVGAAMDGAQPGSNATGISHVS